MLPRSLSLALFPLAFYLSSLLGPLPPVFFSSIHGKRRVPLTGTSNQGFLRNQDSRPVKLYSLPFFLPSFPPYQLVSPFLFSVLRTFLRPLSFLSRLIHSGTNDPWKTLIARESRARHGLRGRTVLRRLRIP